MCFQRYQSLSSLILAIQTDRGRRTRTRITRNFPGRWASYLGITLLCLTSCQTLHHQFAPLEPDWQSKVGQLQYRGPKTSLIGDVLVRVALQML